MIKLLRSKIFKEIVKVIMNKNQIYGELEKMIIIKMFNMLDKLNIVQLLPIHLPRLIFNNLKILLKKMGKD
jgi:hypothetical protein